MLCHAIIIEYHSSNTTSTTVASTTVYTYNFIIVGSNSTQIGDGV